MCQDAKDAKLTELPTTVLKEQPLVDVTIPHAYSW